MRAPEKTVNRARKLRREMSLPEIVLWQALRKKGLARLRFRRDQSRCSQARNFLLPAWAGHRRKFLQRVLLRSS